jgi:hydrogenase maturation protease
LSKKVVVLGLGNLLLKDEGIGIHVTRELQKQNLPQNVEIVDGGTASLDALNLTCGAAKLIIIDAVRCGKKPGTLYRLRNKELHQSLKEKKLSLHQFSLVEALGIHKKLGSLPKEIVFIGIEPAQIEWSLEVSSCLKEKIPQIIELVTKEIPN